MLFRSILLVLKMLMNWNAELIDIETAFLHGEMEEVIYMNLPEGLNKIEGEMRMTQLNA